MRAHQQPKTWKMMKYRVHNGERTIPATGRKNDQPLLRSHMLVHVHTHGQTIRRTLKHTYTRQAKNTEAIKRPSHVIYVDAVLCQWTIQEGWAVKFDGVDGTNSGQSQHTHTHTHAHTHTHTHTHRFVVVLTEVIRSSLLSPISSAQM